MEETNGEIFLRTCTKHEDIGSIQHIQYITALVMNARMNIFCCVCDVFVWINTYIVLVRNLKNGDSLFPFSYSSTQQ